MKSSARHPWLSVPVLLFSLAGCGLKGPLYLPDDKQEPVPATTDTAKPVLEGSKVRTLPPAPQAQKRDRSNQSTSPQSPSAPSQTQSPPVSPPDPDRPATPPPRDQ
jgi:predicted small lipoprotein YifL